MFNFLSYWIAYVLEYLKKKQPTTVLMKDLWYQQFKTKYQEWINIVIVSPVNKVN